MTKNSKFDLPNNGYDVIEKILHAYALSESQAVSLGEVASRAGMNKTQISSNHNFLVAVGVLEGGNKKKLTDKGRQLASAISKKISDKISQYWADVMRECEHTRNVLNMVRVRNGIKKQDMQVRVLSALSMADRKSDKTGVNCLIEIMLKAGLILDQEDMYVYNAQFDSAGSGTEDVHAEGNESDTAEPADVATQAMPLVIKSQVEAVPSIHIDVQIHIDASAKSEQIDKIFESTAKYLYGRS